MIKIIGPRDPRIPGALNVTSCSKDWGKNLSPMILGPVGVPRRGFSICVENAWQYSKVYEQHLDKNGNPNAAWYAWSQQGFKKSRGERYPMGKAAIPVYSYWDGKKLDYLEAREAIYIPIYAKAAVRSGWYDKLEQEYYDKGFVTMWDYDGYDYLNQGKTLDDCRQDHTKPLGHSFVLALMLKGMV